MIVFLIENPARPSFVKGKSWATHLLPQSLFAAWLARDHKDICSVHAEPDRPSLTNSAHYKYSYTKNIDIVCSAVLTATKPGKAYDTKPVGLVSG
jgi:hypothetical protein